jgi:hypothetical protein
VARDVNSFAFVMSRYLPLTALTLLLAACDGPITTSPPPRTPDDVAGETPPPPPPATATAEQHAEHHSDHDGDHHDDDAAEEAEHAHDGDPIALTPAEARVLVLQTTELSRPAEVVGVVDAHEKMGHHDEALAHLKARAAALGADAVVGVEFHHGEGEGEPTHLSGLAVRFLHGAP